MTSVEFVDAVMGLGIELRPHPEPEQNCQYQAVKDPASPQRASISQEEGLILARLASGARVLEIGTGLGISTVCLASTADEVVTIDPDKWVRDTVDPGPHVTMLASVADAEGPFDLAFIDGDHAEESVRRDILDCLLLVRPGGSIAFHDVSQEQVKLVVDEFQWAKREQYETVGLLTVCEVPA